MNPKMKSENYTNFGGINSKISKYDNNAMEFLDIINYDFQTPGALSERWGSTQYISQNFSGPIHSLFEFSKLDGSSYIVTSVSGGIWFGATTGTYQGVSLNGIGSTQVFSAGGPGYAFGFTGGFIRDQVLQFYNGDPQRYYEEGSATMFAASQTQGSNKLSFTVMNNELFAADGSKFFKFDGASTYPVGLPFPTVFQSYGVFGGGSATFSGITLNNAAAATTVGIQSITTTSYAFFASYVNNRGFESQIWPIAYLDLSAAGVSILGGTFIQAWMSMVTPQSYGISSINVYSFATNATLTFGVSLIDTRGSTLWDPPYIFQGNYPVSGSTNITVIPLGTSLGNLNNMLNNVGPLADLTENTYFPLGASLSSGASVAMSGNQITSFIYPNFYPRYLENYKNRLFASGFSATPSTVWFSDVAEPEGFSLDSNFEVRTNDADVITCMKAYATRLYIFKQNSFHALFGDNPENFFLQEVSVIYGCLNNNSAVIYDDILVFLDRHGVMLYNGANVQCLSNKVQPYFDRMNFNAAVQRAVMVHDKLRNQILVAIPIDGSSTNNITMVYDYLNGSWTTYNGFVPTIFATIQGYNNTKNAFYGSFSGTINWFGPSFLSDNAQGFTAYFKTRFIHDLGESIEKQFRRLYLNIDNFGTTLTFPVNFYQDYGTSTVLSSTIFIDGFQNRLEFGIPAKSLAFDISSFQASFPLKIYGFTIESRLQRRV